MGRDTTSRTEHTSWIEETMAGLSGHYETAISGSDGTVKAAGRTAEESQANASDMYHKE